jgi:DNA-binding NtrC family response regulator
MELQALKNKFNIIGNSPALNYALTTAEKVASTDLTVLIMGESGVGKEIFSNIIHQLSGRKHNPFIAINCGAIPEGTIDSELFGHEKGSFTGAIEKRKGYFETVDGGTIFLDEIAEMPLGTQSRLLRLLQNGELIKVGASQIQKVNVRVVAATNINLIEAVQKGKFREDLYYRLSTVPITVPALRDRGDDIYLLFRKFASDFCEKNGIKMLTITDEAKQMILSYRWPGNVRQLKNIAEQICILSEADTIYPEDLVKFIPNYSTTLNLSGNVQDFGGLGNEMTIKMLVDIKHDLNDIKRMFFELSKTSTQSTDQFSNYQENIEAKVSAIDRYIQPNPSSIYSKPNVIELPERNVTKRENESELPPNFNLIDMEKKYIELALKKNKGKRKYAAEELGISERTLYRKIIDYNLEE